MHVDHTKNIIEVKNVSFSYGKEKILEDISLNIHKGDYLGIVGPNGGGKTTLLKIILGLLPLQSGSITLFDQSRNNFSHWAKIGYVAQKSLNFDAKFPATVFEVVSMGLYGKKGLFKMFNEGDKKKVLEALENVEMKEFKDRLIGDLSGGQQQRVFIARALVGRPEIIFLDEPTVGVDIRAQEQFYSLLHTLNRELQITLVLVSHDVDVVARETTEVMCINQTLVYHGSPKDFIKPEVLEKLYGKGVKFILHDH